MVEYFLLYGKQDGEQANKSPLAVFDSELILSLDDSKLESIAGEDPWTKQQRDTLSPRLRTWPKLWRC
jgi:hypothetical protein